MAVVYCKGRLSIWGLLTLSWNRECYPPFKIQSNNFLPAAWKLVESVSQYFIWFLTLDPCYSSEKFSTQIPKPWILQYRKYGYNVHTLLSRNDMLSMNIEKCQIIIYNKIWLLRIYPFWLYTWTLWNLVILHYGHLFLLLFERKMLILKERNVST